MRTLSSLLLGLVAAVFAIVGSTMPFMLPAQAAKDRVYYEQFQRAAAHVRRTGQLPAGQTLRHFEATTNGPSIWSSLTTTPLDCDPSFAKVRSDRFVLSFWRGEWSECYAYPSGRTTLPMSVKAYLLSGVGLNLAVYWLIAIAAAWGALRLHRAQPSKKRSALIS